MEAREAKRTDLLKTPSRELNRTKQKTTICDRRQVALLAGLESARRRTTTTNKLLQFACLAITFCLLGGLARRSPVARADSDANRLYEDLMMTYNRIVRPVQNESDRVVVRLGLKLSQLMDVNLKNQMMTINVWLNQEWSDYKLKWDPSEYGGIEDINLPAEQIWLPDIALYNSAEGYFAVSIMTKAKVRYDGYVIWNPPAIFRSSCQIDITYFPFDSQNCHLKFGSWTFGTKIDLRHINETEGTIERGTDLSEYYQNVEWDIMQASAIRNVIKYDCCPNDFYPDVTFHFKLRRKPLFYTVNLILPCVGITFFSFLVFYLPSDSGEKVTLTISILVSLIFFLSVLIETIPSTSLAMPLLGKYLVFTMILITLSVCATVCVLNIHFRTPSTHSMPPWIKRWCMDVLPKYLFMSVPQYQSQQANILPEQLIYLHNQAYANQAVTMPLQPSNSFKSHGAGDANRVCCQANSINAPGATNLAAGHHFHANQTDQANQTTPLNRQGSAHRQQQPMSLNVNDLIASSTLPASRPTTFLPYLQSEAARRLQVQRSRSSERDNKSTSDNQQTASGSSTNNGGKSACDTKTPQTETKSQQQAHTRGHSSAQEASTSSNVANMRQPNKSIEQNVTKSKNSSSRPFWRLFKSSKSDGPSEQEPDQPNNTEPRRSRDMSSSTSSTVGYADDDDDYKHHRHFQARASICSNNLWRIGPTRRCSLAVPTANYPSYYRPLAQLQHRHGSGGGTGLSTISGGCLPPIPAHYHTHGEDSSTSSNDTAGEAVKSLINATATNLLQTRQVYGGPQRSAAHIDQVREMEALTSGGFVRAEPQYPYPVEAIPPRQSATPNSFQSDSQNTLPTPPPPLPPDLHDAQVYGDRSTATTMRMQQYQQQQQLRQDPNTNWQASNHTMAHLERDSSTSTTTTQYRQVMPAPIQPVYQYLAMARGQARQHENVNMVQQNEAVPMMPMTNSYLGGQNDGKISMIQPQQRPQHSHVIPVANHSFGGVDCSAQYLNIAQQSMPRSRSTDYRLSSMPRDISTNSLLTYAHGVGNSNQLRQQIYHVGAHQQPVFNHQQQQHQSIGRQLGQAYIQRLQRQPTIYSLHHSRLLPALTQRDVPPLSATRSKYDDWLGPQPRLENPDSCLLQHYHEPSIDMLRRSKSQTSLHRRAQAHGCSTSVDYRRCMGEEPISGDPHHHNLPSCELANRPKSEMRGRFNSTGCRRYDGDLRALPAQAILSARRCDEAADQEVARCTASLARTSSATKTRQHSNRDQSLCRCSALEQSGNSSTQQQQQQQQRPMQLSTLSMLKLINEVDKAIQNAMFIAQHIDNLDEFESVKENWKYIAMVIDRIFLIVFLFACIVGTVAIFALVPWSYYLNEKPIDLQLTRLMALNLTSGEALTQGCHEF